MSIVSSSGILVNKDLMSKLTIITLLVLKGKFSICLTKENVSGEKKGEKEEQKRNKVKKGEREEQKPA